MSKLSETLKKAAKSNITAAALSAMAMFGAMKVGNKHAEQAQSKDAIIAVDSIQQLKEFIGEAQAMSFQGNKGSMDVHVCGNGEVYMTGQQADGVSFEGLTKDGYGRFKAQMQDGHVFYMLQDPEGHTLIHDENHPSNVNTHAIDSDLAKAAGVAHGSSSQAASFSEGNTR
ncbi:MAG: hypothetical protein J6Y85_01665 [Alphaproteobacteria bacterium]|nr:hypothetical protein [Alphaproteobacteria bacterium]